MGVMGGGPMHVPHSFRVVKNNVLLFSRNFEDNKLSYFSEHCLRNYTLTILRKFVRNICKRNSEQRRTKLPIARNHVDLAQTLINSADIFVKKEKIQADSREHSPKLTFHDISAKFIKFCGNLHYRENV